MASGISNTTETNILKVIFQKVDWTNFATCTGTQSDVYVSLHTATLDDDSTQNTSETTYTGYAREAVARASGSGGWNVTGNTATNVDAITFGTCTGGGQTVTHVAIGVHASNDDTILWWGQLDSSLAIGTNVTPEFAAGALDIQLE